MLLKATPILCASAAEAVVFTASVISMSVRHVLGVLVAALVGFCACMQPGDAHANGAEFTYLNMFQPKDVGEHINTESFINAEPSSGGSSRKSEPAKRRLHGSVKKAERIEAPDNALRLQKSTFSDDEKNEDAPEDPPVALHRRKLRSSDDASTKSDKKKVENDNSEAALVDHEPDVVQKSAGDDSHERSQAEAAPAGRIFEGVGGTKDGEDIKRVSFMLMRLLKQYKAESMVDVPCRAHASWMHKFLVEAEREIPNFKYFCVDSNKEILQAMKARVKGRANAKFILRLFWKEKLPRADVVFSWSGLDKMKHENVVKMLRNIATADRHKYVIVGNHVKGSKILAKKARELNFRSEPFRLQKPMRVISKLSVDPVRKQMYLYKSQEMKKSWEEESP